MTRKTGDAPPSAPAVTTDARPGDVATVPGRGPPAEGDFAHLFAESLHLLCIAGFDGFFKRLNPAWTTLLGWSREDLRARPFIDFVHPSDRAATLMEFAALADGAEAIRFENRYRHRDGVYSWLQWSARLVPGRAQIYATARDVTAHRRLEREILEITDREKERLGRELHDGLCQSLAGIAALSTTLGRRLGGHPESATTAEITQLLKEAIREARELAVGLGPIGLRAANLADALVTLSVNTERLFQANCSCEYDPTLRDLPEQVAGHLFRIAQEAVNNALTHGRARKLSISLTRNDNRGLLRIEDDGAGLPEIKGARQGTGLRTMAYRARAIGGRFEVRRRPPGGTAIICSFPLPVPVDT